MAKAKKGTKEQAGKKTSAGLKVRREPKAKKETTPPATGLAPEVTSVQDGHLPKPEETAKTEVATPTRDERLPAVGTKLEKRDRHGEVRCTCEVVGEGIRYEGTTYKSLSGAAMAAAKDLGLKNKTQNGYVFWGLSKPPRPATDPVEALQRVWARYHERAKSAVEATPEEGREQVRQELARQAEAIGALAKQAA